MDRHRTFIILETMGIIQKICRYVWPNSGIDWDDFGMIFEQISYVILLSRYYWKYYWTAPGRPVLLSIIQTKDVAADGTAGWDVKPL